MLSAATAMTLAQKPIRRTRVEAFHFLGIFMFPPFPKCAVRECRHSATALLGGGARWLGRRLRLSTPGLLPGITDSTSTVAKSIEVSAASTYRDRSPRWRIMIRSRSWTLSGEKVAPFDLSHRHPFTFSRSGRRPSSKRRLFGGAVLEARPAEGLPASACTERRTECRGSLEQ